MEMAEWERRMQDLPEDDRLRVLLGSVLLSLHQVKNPDLALDIVIQILTVHRIDNAIAVFGEIKKNLPEGGLKDRDLRALMALATETLHPAIERLFNLCAAVIPDWERPLQ